MSRWTAWFTPVGLVVVVVAACGDGEALSKDQYVAKIDAACVAFAAREAKIGEPKTVADLADHGATIVAAFEDTILDAAATLTPPDELTDEGAKLTVLAREQRNVLGGLVDAARSGSVLKLQQLAAQNRVLNKRASRLTRALGATSCAEN